MNHFWGNVFDCVKERRLAALFFGTLLAMGGLLIVGAILYQIVCAHDLQEYLVYFLPGAVLVLLVWTGRGIARTRARRQARYNTSPLSRDERDKARSKLAKQQ
jgi:cation transport ATPase